MHRRVRDHTEFWRQLGERLRVMRRHHRIPKTQVARALGLADRTAQKSVLAIENGRRALDVREAQVLANLFAVPVSELLP